MLSDDCVSALCAGRPRLRELDLRSVAVARGRRNAYLWTSRAGTGRGTGKEGSEAKEEPIALLTVKSAQALAKAAAGDFGFGRTLTTLRLGPTAISDSAMESLLEHCPRLVSLTVVDSPIGDAAALAIGRHCPAITELDLSGSAKASALLFLAPWALPHPVPMA